MPVLPALQALLDALPPFPALDLDPEKVAGLREAGLAGSNALAATVAEAPRPVGTVTTEKMPVEGGEITLRIYQPEGPGPHPIHVYYHGGGWAAGTIEEVFVDVICRERTALAGYVTIAVEYRLAPEHKFPVPLDDSYAALLWAAEHAPEFNAKPDLITIGGGSAGANLAAAITLKARDEEGPKIAFQVLEIPALDLTLTGPGYELYGNGEYPLPLTDIETYRAAYLPTADDRKNPLASPLLAEDLSQLPPALILSSEYDPLQFDGSRYAERLNDAGVEATFILGAGQIHGSSQFTKLLPESAAWRDEVITYLRAHARPQVPAKL